MYSRDIFPKYTSGGLPIPENYSGNAIRRSPPPGNVSGGRSGQTPATGSGTPRVHTPAVRPASGLSQNHVPLTVSPTFVAQSEPSEPEKRQETRPPLSPPERGIETEPPQEAGEESVSEPAATREATEPEAKTVSAKGSHEGGGLSSLLSAFLPPKPGGVGVLSQIGLEEALLLGLFLLLSQSEEEEDTLMLLALLFLYR